MTGRAHKLKAGKASTKFAISKIVRALGELPEDSPARTALEQAHEQLLSAEEIIVAEIAEEG